MGLTPVKLEPLLEPWHGIGGEAQSDGAERVVRDLGSPAVCLGDRFYDREPEAAAASLAVVVPCESLEREWPELCREAGTFVGHGDVDLVGAFAQGDCDGAPAVGEGVVDDVADGLLHA